jgi:N-acetylglucosaminyl-diphospho-decaprenol L-rhamnosyltransferase
VVRSNEDSSRNGSIDNSNRGKSPAMEVRQTGVDVVIPTRNTRALTLECLRSLLEDSPRESRRLIVVDNASDDGTEQAVCRAYPDVDLVRCHSNVGFARACNIGAAHGHGRYILFLNSDIVARGGSVDRLVEALRTDGCRVAAGGHLVNRGTDETQVGFVLRAFPTLSAQLALLVGLERFWPTNPVSRRQLMLDFDYGLTQDVNAQPAGACLLCPREEFEAVGGFDESFYFWFEDVDLVRRLRHRGKIVYVHDAIFEHLGSGTFSQWARPEIVATRYRSLLQYFVKHHSRVAQRVLAAVIAALGAVRAVALLPIDRQRARAYAAVVELAARHAAGDPALGRPLAPPALSEDPSEHCGQAAPPASQTER